MNDFRFSYIQGRNSLIFVCIDLVLSHETKNSRSTNISTSVDVTEVLYRGNISITIYLWTKSVLISSLISGLSVVKTDGFCINFY
jgi:hypothetical protein